MTSLRPAPLFWLLGALGGGLLPCRAAEAPLALLEVPPLALPAGQGLVVDSYDNGLFCGVFNDDEGSALALAVAPHRGGKNGSFLYGDFRIVPGGFAGFWSRVGEAWQGRQDWSQARALTFAACTSRPMTFRITLKGEKDQKLNGTVATTEVRRWQRLTLAIKDLDSIAGGLGIVPGSISRSTGDRGSSPSMTCA